jgi:hypothetical protein
MKANIKTIALGLFVCLNHYLQAQVSSTNAELHNRYWNYRENFRKYFTIIGPNAGEGMPFSTIEPNHSPENHKVDASGNYIDGGTLKGNINVGGDVTAYYAEYLAVLASEYWLLHNDGKAGSQEEKAVLNELYFAIYAIG